MKKTATSKKAVITPKKVEKTKTISAKSPSKKSKLNAEGTIYVKPNPETVSLLKGFYYDVELTINKLSARKKKLDHTQLMNKFNKIADIWAIEIDKSLGKENVFKFNFSIPETKKSDFKKVLKKQQD